MARIRQLISILGTAFRNHPALLGTLAISGVLVFLVPWVFERAWPVRHWCWLAALAINVALFTALGIHVVTRVFHRLLDEIDARDQAVRRGARGALLSLRARVNALERKYDDRTYIQHKNDSGTSRGEIELLKQELDELRKRLERAE